MKYFLGLILVFSIMGIGASCMLLQDAKITDTKPISTKVVRLPKITTDGDVSVETALSSRRSIRSYRDEPLSLVEIAQLLWAAQGITEKGTGKRTAPSAGALYPLEIYLVAGNVDDLSDGVYKYQPAEHKLVLISEREIRDALAHTALDQECVRDGGAVLVFAAVYARTTQKYGQRGIRYVHMEVGHAAQNVFLQAGSLGLGTVVVGAFDDESVREVVGMAVDEQPLYIMPVGRI